MKMYAFDIIRAFLDGEDLFYDASMPFLLQIHDFAHTYGCEVLADAARATLGNTLLRRGLVPDIRFMGEAWFCLSPDNFEARSLVLECFFIHAIEKALPVNILFRFNGAEDQDRICGPHNGRGWLQDLHKLVRHRMDATQWPRLAYIMVNALSQDQMDFRHFLSEYLALAHLSFTKRKQSEEAERVERTPESTLSSDPLSEPDSSTVASETSHTKTKAASAIGPRAKGPIKPTRVPKRQPRDYVFFPTSVPALARSIQGISSSVRSELQTREYEYYSNTAPIALRALADPDKDKALRDLLNASKNEQITLLTASEYYDKSIGITVSKELLSCHSEAVRELLMQKPNVQKVVIEHVDADCLQMLASRITQGPSESPLKEYSLLCRAKCALAAERLQMPKLLLECLDILENDFCRRLKQPVTYLEQYFQYRLADKPSYFRDRIVSIWTGGAEVYHDEKQKEQLLLATSTVGKGKKRKAQKDKSAPNGKKRRVA
ncbi:hypothetical protein OHC33_001786 [Knufia fluminis]|uniref:Uncharacterized protein n=1 Tax=Knufia fluminis TaxID=191047 RepID=A0AAN8IRS5_9EURO|nr:hypothetical protein OHC33_001786 [Knufia fluminis]